METTTLISADQTWALWAVLLSALPVSTAANPAGDDVSRLQRRAVKHGLSAYDAAYLDLADRMKIGLATLDQRLAKAAHADGIRVYSG
jgi:predicted nucleic acid-binding protein